MDKPAEILEAIQERQNDNQLLRQRMEDDFDLLSLKPFVPEIEGNETYTTTKPRNFFDKVTDAINRAQLTLQIKLAEDATDEQRRAASIGELFLFGALAAIDRRLTKRGEPPFRETMGFHINCRGWYGLRALVYVPKDEKDTVFDVEPWDIMHTTWEFKDDGLLWAAYQYQSSRKRILDKWGIEIAGRFTTVTDFWDGDVNGIMVEGGWVKEPESHKIGHVPVLIGRVGSIPTVTRMTDPQLTTDLQGDSVWAASRHIYNSQNKYVSWVMDMVKRSTTGSLLHESLDGTKKLLSDPYRTRQEIQLSTAAQEKLRPLEMPQAPAEMAAVLQVMNDDLQQSSLPYPLAYGGTEEAMSGRAFSVLSDATRSVYNPRTGAMARIYTWLGEELLHQYATKGMKSTELRGYNGKEEFFKVTVQPKDIDPSWFVEVHVEPRLSRDREQEIAQALAATQRRGPEDIPLVSKATAREEYLRIRDPDAEGDKVLAEMGEGLRPIQVANIAAALKRRGKDVLAEQVLVLLGGPDAATVPHGPGGLAPMDETGAAPPTVPPDLLEAVVRVLGAAGQQRLAQALVSVLVPPPTPGAGQLSMNGGGPVGPLAPPGGGMLR